MKVLLTGASSFTGFWFAAKLAALEAEVTAPLRGTRASYQGVRASRVAKLSKCAEIIEGVSFGDDGFLDLVSSRGFDVLCHHAAEVADYRSADFDVQRALSQNTRRFREVIERMARAGLKAVVATGSVFEQDEGVGTGELQAFSPYGLSKGLSYQVMRYWCASLGVPLGKFVIANPFGPYEEHRFCAYLVGKWRNGEAAEVRTPSYLRDNIHVDLLASVYARFVFEMASSRTDRRFGPCGYVETQGAFAERVARELAPRLNLNGELRLATQTVFSEPLARINSDVISLSDYAWSESEAWDGMAEYYSRCA